VSPKNQALQPRPVLIASLNQRWQIGALCRAEHGLAQSDVGRIRREMLEAFEQAADETLQTRAAGIVGEGLNLIHAIRESAQFSLSLRFLIETKLKNTVFYTLSVC
jgi:hypothetical protein